MKNLKYYCLLSGMLLALIFGSATNLSAQNSGGQKVTVSGIITSAEDSQPLIGVAVVVAETLQGVTSGIDGSYSIDAVAGQTISYTFLGCKEVLYTVPAGAATAKYDVVMQSDTESIDDVVVIAYGVRKKGTVAGSVSSVKIEKIESTPTAAFDQALQGQVPGLSVMSNTGEPSASATMTIRGTNSINSGTAPLYILDGVPISASDFNTINPADIELSRCSKMPPRHLSMVLVLPMV